eukprot:TRINITY_DN5375_c0_g1_i1.p1 TRINITY_DN5375_c0_g1~~TRINITY_DN5375_c0_g1_i1.p1  ORF type:complete len:503 (-),score=152.58 TRINITY_DN5375_c0_g1_i1:99-1562(-)
MSNIDDEDYDSEVSGEIEKKNLISTSNISESSNMSKEERRLLWKLDLIILPITMLLFLAAYLDRGVMGNARLLGLERDILENNPKYFNWALSIFYVGHIAFMIPGNIFAKIFSPSKWMGFMCVMWGLCSALQAVCTNFAGLATTRFFLGLFEAGYGPAVPLYFSFWYKRNEMALRNALFIGSSASAGAFSGLIAYAVDDIDTTMMAKWKILFLLESVPTIALGFFTMFALPDRPQSSKYLNEEERKIALERIGGPARSGISSLEKDQIILAFKDYKVWLSGVMYFGYNIAIASISSFMPTILHDLGYQGARAQLMSVPPYTAAFVVMILSALSSDKIFFERGLHLTFCGACGTFGYLVLFFAESQTLRYLAIFFVTFGVYPCIPLVLSWVSNNSGTETKRAVSLAVTVIIGHLFGSIIGTQIYPKSDGPAYRLGFSACAGSMALASLASLTLHFLLRRENARRIVKEKDPNHVYGKGDMVKGFRYII